ncbi:MAG TPA: hypothetical protein VL461_07470 [Dictyobacter sp.]|jgi:membrane-associated phospholipid phosphatase|nr:hypothetical protein [Dictyobacter sp.]
MLENQTKQERNKEILLDTAHPFSLQAARFISTVLSPAIIALPVLLLVALSTHQSNALLSALIAIFFLSIGPMIYIGIGVRMGKFTDIDVSVRSQRTGPFLFGLGSCLLGFMVLVLTHAPRYLQDVLLLICISGLILMIITFWWKISMHTSSLSAAITLLIMIYGRIILPASILIVLVCWSRVVLKRHTIAQVTAGTILGIGLCWLLLTLMKM